MEDGALLRQQFINKTNKAGQSYFLLFRIAMEQNVHLFCE